MAVNQTLSQYISSCNDDELYRLFEVIIAEMNKRKEQAKCQTS